MTICYYEPFTLDGEPRKPIVEYEGFAYSHDHGVVEQVCGPRIARLVTRCKVLERCGELMKLVKWDAYYKDVFQREIGHYAMRGDDAALNELAHRIAKEAGL